LHERRRPPSSWCMPALQPPPWRGIQGVFSCNFPPISAALVQVYSLVPRGADASALYKLNAVLEVVDVRLRRNNLRGMVSEGLVLESCSPFPGALVPVDTLDLRGGGVLRMNTAVLNVVVARQRRGLLCGVGSEVCSLEFCPPFPAALVPKHTLELRGGGVLLLSTAVLDVVAICLRCGLLRSVGS